MSTRHLHLVWDQDHPTERKPFDREEDPLDTARGIAFGLLVCLLAFWTPLAFFIYWLVIR